MIPRLHGVGRLGADPKSYTTKNGKALAKVSIAFSEKTGQNDETVWLEAAAFGGTADFLTGHFKKGDSIEVIGRLHENRWNDRDGNAHAKLTLILERIGFVCPKNSGAKTKQKSQDKQRSEQQNPTPQVDVDDDEIPF